MNITAIFVPVLNFADILPLVNGIVFWSFGQSNTNSYLIREKYHSEIKKVQIQSMI